MTAACRRSKLIEVGRHRGGARLLGCLVVVGLLAGCGLGDKAQVADQIIDSVSRLEQAGPAHGNLVVALKLIELPVAAAAFGPAAGSPGGEGGAAGGSFAGAPIVVTVDLKHQRAALGAADQPALIFDGLLGYGRRLEAAEGDARPWMKVDLADLAEGDSKVNFTRLAPDALRNALNPSFVVDLIAGALSGSVEQMPGTETLAGTPTTKYEANFDIEKAVGDTRRDRYPEDDRDAAYELLDLLTVSGRVFPGAVWLDGEGRPRRFQIALRVSPQKGFVLEIGFDLMLERFGDEGVPANPTDLELLETDSLAGFLQAVTPAVQTP